MYKKLICGICLTSLLTSVFAQKNDAAVPDTSGKKIIVKGIVEKGIEAGCTILKTEENKIYLLLNLKTSVTYGSCIKATGYIQKNHIGVCMQGTPFYVINYCPCSKKSKPKYQRELPKDKIIKERN